VALINNQSLIFPWNIEDERMGEIRMQNMKTIDKKGMQRDQNRPIKPVKHFLR